MQLICNQKVGGSNPSPGTRKSITLCQKPCDIKRFDLNRTGFAGGYLAEAMLPWPLGAHALKRCWSPDYCSLFPTAAPIGRPNMRTLLRGAFRGQETPACIAPSRAENAISGIAEPRADIAILIQFFVNRRGPDWYIGMGLPHMPNPLWRGE